MPAELTRGLAVSTGRETSAGIAGDTDAVAWLVDNARAYDAIIAAIAAAQSSVWITQLALDADCVAYATGHGGGDQLLVDALLDADARGVDVRILLNASLLLDTAKPLAKHLASTGGGIRLRGVSRFPQLLHAKMLIADGREAFLVGSPFVNGYWDDSRHRPADERRPQRELGGRPLHDVSVHLTGPTVADLAGSFADLWNEVSGAGAAGEPVPRTLAPPGRRGPLRIARTAARGMIAGHPDGIDEILAALLEGIDGARRSIYVEHQYLSARPIADALVRALAREPALEIVVLLNQNPDVTAYRGWQNERLRETGLLHHPRVGLFALWSADFSEARPQINQVFVHSKVVTIDDEWATAGSANLDGVSLHSYGADFAGVVARKVFRHVRNFDVNVVVDERGSAESTTVRDLRERLWLEHLGHAGTAPAADGLGLWRERSARNVEIINGGSAGERASLGPLVLPYSMRSRPLDQLADVGVDLRRAGLELQFNPGWLEVHASPNWVRNMFG